MELLRGYIVVNSLPNGQGLGMRDTSLLHILQIPITFQYVLWSLEWILDMLFIDEIGLIQILSKFLNLFRFMALHVNHWRRSQILCSYILFWFPLGV